MGLLDSALNAQIPSTRSRLSGVVTEKLDISNEILQLLKKQAYTPTELANHFHMSREWFSKNYLYPLKDDNKIEKIQGSNYYQLKKDKNTSTSIKKAIRDQYEIFKTELYKNWIKKNHAKVEDKKRIRFANICMGFVNPEFKIHPDNITKENWKSVVTNIVDSMIKVVTYDLSEHGELNYMDRQAIRHAIKYGLGIEISETEGIELKITGRKD